MDYGTYKPNRSGKRYYDLSIPRRPFGYAPSFGPARPPFEGENKTCRSPCVARQRLRWRRRSAKEPQALRSAQRVVVLSGLVATPEEPKAVGSNLAPMRPRFEERSDGLRLPYLKILKPRGRRAVASLFKI